MTISKIIVWLIIGALAGTLAGRLVTFSKQGLGFWTNLGLGMLGAVVGGGLFWLLGIQFQKRRQHFVGAGDEPFSVIAVRICNPDRSVSSPGG